jgi:hypothetical protein
VSTGPEAGAVAANGAWLVAVTVVVVFAVAARAMRRRLVA